MRKTANTATIITSRKTGGRREGKITKKLKNKRGFTLVELLCALAVLILLTSCVTVGIGFSAKSYETITKNTNAKELSGMLTTLISDELRFATKIEPTEGGTLESYKSITQGSGASIVSKDDMICVRVFNKEKNEEEYWNIVSPKAYESGCRVPTPVINYSPTDKMFTVTLVINDKSNKEIMKQTFEVEAIK